ncbi:hypothetical protein D918_04742 [Trichuris suis]|nr:hypothetical protein D918_04742 [Trichuris suis]
MLILCTACFHDCLASNSTTALYPFSLNEAYSRSMKTFDDINMLTKWLWGIEQEVHSFGSPTSGKELCAMIKRHKQILEELRSKSETIESAVCLGGVIIDAVDQADETTRQLKQQFLNAREQWRAVCQQMESRLSILTGAYELWKEFQGSNCFFVFLQLLSLGFSPELVAVERVSLDRLEETLKEPMKSAADAEEFSEQLDEFERQMEGGGGHSRIMEIAQALNSQKLLSSAIKSELNKYLARREEVLEPARERQKFLESDAREAQNIEQQLHECLSWLSQVDFILKTRSECDILASDVPEDYKKLYDDFDSHKNSIFRLEKQIAHYQQADQQLAAQRLAEQVNHLKKYMCDLQSKLERYKQPSELEDRLRRVRRILDDLEQSFELLTVTSDDLEEIDQLLEKVEVTDEAICELQGEVGDLKATRAKAQPSSSTVGTLEIEELEEALRSFHVKVMESRDKYQSIKDMLTVSSTNLQTCSELLNEVESELRKSEGDDTPAPEDRRRLALAHRKQVADCSKYLRDTQVGLQKFSELTSPEAAAELQSILDLLRNKISIINGKLDEWALINEKLTKEVVELQKKFFDIHADVACELNLTESDISQCGNDHVCLQTQLDYLKSLRPKVDSLKETAVELIAKQGDPLHAIEAESSQLCRRWESLLESTKDQLTQAPHTNECDNQKTVSVTASFGKEGASFSADTEECRSTAATEQQVSVDESGTQVNLDEESFTADGLTAQANALADSIVSVEDLLIESEKDFAQLQSKFQDVSNTVEACSCHVHQLLDRSEKEKCAELRPTVVPILSKLETMDSKLKMLSKKVKTLIDINENHKRKHEVLSAHAKSCLANLVFLEVIDILLCY